jgi:TonB family protein
MKKFAQSLCLALPLLLASCTNTQTSAPSALLPPDSTDSTVYHLKDLDTRPEPKSTKAFPEYPHALKKAGVAGQAIISFVVDVSGSTRDVEIVSATHPAFGRAAADAVAKWKFKPGVKDGRPVNTRMQVPVGFNLNRS